MFPMLKSIDSSSGTHALTKLRGNYPYRWLFSGDGLFSYNGSAHRKISFWFTRNTLGCLLKNKSAKQFSCFWKMTIIYILYAIIVCIIIYALIWIFTGVFVSFFTNLFRTKDENEESNSSPNKPSWIWLESVLKNV